MLFLHKNDQADLNPFFAPLRDAFDLKSFFVLHDLNNDGKLDAAEIESVYGVHHEYSQKLTPEEAVRVEKAKQIVAAVLKRMDTNGNGFITADEFEAAGMAGLPDFSDLGAEGHHYDVESEFFLHHEGSFSHASRELGVY